MEGEGSQASIQPSRGKMVPMRRYMYRTHRTENQGGDRAGVEELPVPARTVAPSRVALPESDGHVLGSPAEAMPQQVRKIDVSRNDTSDWIPADLRLTRGRHL